MNLEEARGIIGVFVNDFGNEAEGKAWDLILGKLDEPPFPAPWDQAQIVPKKEAYPVFMLEIDVRFYREKSYIEKKIRITEEMLNDFFSGPEELATSAFKDLFREIWKRREEEKG